MSLSKLYQLADSWEREGNQYLHEAGNVSQQGFAHCILSCVRELRQVLSEVQKESPVSLMSRAGECGDSFGECVSP